VGSALLWLAAVITAGVSPAPAHAATLWPRPAQYTAALSWNASAQVLSGTERISFANDSPRSLSSVWVRVWPNGYGSCSKPWARVTVARGGHVAAQRVGCTALRVRLARAVPAGSSAAFTLRLRVAVPKKPDRFGRERGVAYLGNALPLLDVQGPSGVSLEPYTSIGDPFYSLVARWSVRLDLPRSLSAATTGSVTRSASLRGGRRRLFVTAPATRDFAIAIGRFSVDSAVTSGGVRLRYFRVPGESTSTSRAMLDVARAAVETYSSWYGPPGVNEIDLVPGPGTYNGFGSGMEYPGLVMIADDAEVVAHEIAHQWWYSLVGDDQWRSPWLDESFAEFSARRLPASVVPRDGLDCDPSNPVRPFGSALLTDSMRHWDAAGSGPYFQEVYLGGTCALRSLEHDWGADAMTAFLRSYADAHRWGVVTTADFESALRAAAPPGYDVDAFLRRARIEP
jgi:Peptidase family M1 domain